MKKLINLNVLLLLPTIFWASCSSTESISEVSAQVEPFANSQTIQQLKSTNEEILKDYHDTRAWTTKDKIKVVTADVTGAWSGFKTGASVGAKIGMCLGSPITGGAFGSFIGAVVGASFCSWLAAPDMQSVSIDSTEECKDILNACSLLIGDDYAVNRDLVIFEDTTQQRTILADTILNNLQLESIDLAQGELHNIILDLKEERAYLDTTVLETTIMTTGYDCIKDSIYRSEELINECARIANNYITEIPLESQDQDKVDYIINLFMEVFSEYVNDNDDIVLIINR